MIDQATIDLSLIHISHPIALMQCREFLQQHPDIKVVEGEDTADVYKRQGYRSGTSEQGDGKERAYSDLWRL